MELVSGKHHVPEPGRAVSAYGAWGGRGDWLVCLFLLVSQLGLAQSIRLDSVVVINASGQPVRLLPGRLIDLPAQQNYLTFHCSARPPAPIRYRLDGLDEDWLTGLSTDRIHYANLSGGTYTFRLWNGAGKTIRQPIRIDVPFWKRAWFWPLVIVYLIGVLGVLIYLFVRYRFLQQLRQLKVRDRIARDLHDDMGSYLSSISILSANLPADPARARQNLDRIGHTARQVMDAMSDIVWSINPAQDAMQQVIDRMKQVADELFGDTGTAVVFAVGPGVDTLTLPIERRRDFFLIYKESITNAARYAQATRIDVCLDVTGGLLRLHVGDNGRGFDTTHPTPRPGGGNGLTNLRVRADALAGTLTVGSAPGQGTSVTLRVPV